MLAQMTADRAVSRSAWGRVARKALKAAAGSVVAAWAAARAVLALVKEAAALAAVLAAGLAEGDVATLVGEVLPVLAR